MYPCRLGRANDNVVDGDEKKLHKESNKAHHHTADTRSEGNLWKLCSIAQTQRQVKKQQHKQVISKYRGLYSKALISIVNLVIGILPVFQFPPSIKLL